MTQHTLFIIPGSVAPAKRYAKLASYIESTSDFKVHVYTLPTTSNGPPNGPAAGLIDDVAFTKAKLQELIHSGEDILLLAHSYGAMVANIVAKDLGKEQRLKHGLRGGITRIIYLCAIIAPTGQSVADVCQHLDLSWLNEPKESGEPSRYPPDSLEARTEAAMKNMRARSRRSYLDKATYSAYLDIPVTYIVCEDDDILGQEFQRGRIDFLREIKGLDQVQVESLKAGHRPMDTDPEAAGKKIVEILSKL